MNLNITNWKEFSLGDLFTEMYKAEAHIKAEYDFFSAPAKNTIRFISRTEDNNGCDCYILNNDLSGIEKGQAIVIGDTTATCSYQSAPFVCGDHMVICRADWINIYTALFLISIIKREKYKYSYGRAFKMQLISQTRVKLPATADNQPDWYFMERYIKSLNHKPLSTANQRGSESHIPGVNAWKNFCISDLFEVKKGKRLTSADQTEGATPYIGAIDSNNGVANYIGQKSIHSGNTISLSYNGSVGEAFYQPNPFWATDDVNVLYFKSDNGVLFNKYIALFICTILRQEKYRYSYGRKWVLESMKATIIKLPSKNDKPDWNLMENYMKSLPYGDRI